MPLTVAISPKALKHLEGTELGKLISVGKVLEDGSIEIATDETIDAKLQTAKGEREGKHSALADRLVVKVADARAREASAPLDDRGGPR